MEEKVMSKPAVSVVVPVYNVEKYLRECLDSIINQTLKDIEIILVDDGSPDNCPQICDEYAAKDARIKVIHKPNGGYGSAVNRGIEEAIGEYIGIVESDDWIEHDMYEKLYNNAKESNSDVCICDFYHARNSGNTIHEYITKKNIGLNECFNLLSKPEIMYQPAYPWNKLYKKEFLDTNQIKMFEDKRMYQDITWNSEILSKCKLFSYINEPLYYYRYDSVNSSTNIGNLSTINYLYKRKEAREILIKNNVFDTNVKEWYWISCIRGAKGYYNRIKDKYKHKFYNKMRKMFRLALKDNCNFIYFKDEDKKYFERVIKWGYWHYFLIQNKKTILETIFSVKNDSRQLHKIITLLGIKMKFKKKTSQKIDVEFTKLNNKIDRLTNLMNYTISSTTIPQATGDLRLQQLASLGILKKLVEFLNEHKLSYWLEFGTLLGAVRHKGFIPWDDDIDIAMPYEDYKKLKEIIHLFCKNGYYYSDGEILRISYKSTLAQVDIFPFYSGNSTELPTGEEYKNFTNKLQALYNQRPVVKGIWNNLRFKHESSLPDWYKKKIYDIYSKELLENKSIPEKAYLFLGYECFAYKRVLCKYDEIFPLKPIIFENLIFNSPNNTYMHLHNYWGDFYKLPNKIASHDCLKNPLNNDENYHDLMELLQG